MRWFFGVLGVLLLVVSAVLTLARLLDVDVAVLASGAAFASYAVVTYLLALVLLGLLAIKATRVRPWLAGGAVLALAGFVFHSYTLVPLYAGKGAGTHTDLTVMTSNLEFGAGDASTVVETATKRDVDVLVLEEVTPPELTKLKAAGLDSLFPESVGDADTGVKGTMVFATVPLEKTGTLTLANGGLQVTVGGAHRFTLLAVHTAAPDTPTLWQTDQQMIRNRVRALAKKGPLMVVGDFNATTDHAAFRQILGAGLSDATAQANSGWQPTWPTKYRRSWLRPTVAIDHVLTTTQWSAVSTATVSVPDTDHLALVVRLDRL